MIPSNIEPIPLSALAAYAYCPRRFALQQLECIWSDNHFTAKGSIGHERVHAGKNETRQLVDGSTIRIVRAIPLFSSLGMFGISDVVELDSGVPCPVEYKISKIPKYIKLGTYAENIQVCAQAICLEEMFDVTLEHGFIYHIASKKRRVVLFTDELRDQVKNVLAGAQKIVEHERLPKPAADERCKFCSIQMECQPMAPRQFPADYDPFSADW